MKRRGFLRLLGLVPAAAAAQEPGESAEPTSGNLAVPPEQEIQQVQVRPYGSWLCECGYAMIETVLSDGPCAITTTRCNHTMHCVNGNCKHFNVDLDIPTMTAFEHGKSDSHGPKWGPVEIK